MGSLKLDEFEIISFLLIQLSIDCSKDGLVRTLCVNVSALIVDLSYHQTLL